jgi:flagellar hook-associated protein 2
VTASVISPSVGSYQLVLTGTSTGSAHGFTVTNGLTGGAGVIFADRDHDGMSGDSTQDNAVSATDASLTVNNLAIASEANTVDGAVPGATLTLLKKDPNTTVTVTVTRDAASTTSRLDEFVTAFNELIQFVEDQRKAGAEGDPASLARDGLLRGLHNALRQALTSRYAVGGTYSSLPEIGVGFDRTGRLTLDGTAFGAAVTADRESVEKLFGDESSGSGAFGTLSSLIEEYSQAGGLVPNAQTRLDDQVRALTARIADVEERLALRRTALQQEFTAADLVISRLNSQMSSLSSLAQGYQLF